MSVTRWPLPSAAVLKQRCSAISAMGPPPVMAEIYRTRCHELLAANAELAVRLEQARGLVTRQMDRIDLLETLLAPPGKRAVARLRRSPWWVQLARRLGWVA